MTSAAMRICFSAASDDRRAERYGNRRVTENSRVAVIDDVVARIRAGDEAAFEAVYHAHFDALWEFARTLVKSNDVAMDAVQEVFLSLWARRASWNVLTTVQGYLFGAVRNQALKSLRHDRSSARAEHRAELEQRHADEDGEGGRLPDAIAAEHELERAVTRVIESLPERQRTAVELKWRYELSWAEVGEAMGISKVAAWKLGAAAQRRLEPLRERFGRG